MYDGGAYNRRQGSIPVRFGQIPPDPRIWAGIDAEPVAERLAYFFFTRPFFSVRIWQRALPTALQIGNRSTNSAGRCTKNQLYSTNLDDFVLQLDK